MESPNADEFGVRTQQEEDAFERRIMAATAVVEAMLNGKDPIHSNPTAFVLIARRDAKKGKNTICMSNIDGQDVADLLSRAHSAILDDLIPPEEFG